MNKDKKKERLDYLKYARKNIIPLRHEKFIHKHLTPHMEYLKFIVGEGVVPSPLEFYQWYYFPKRVDNKLVAVKASVDKVYYGLFDWDLGKFIEKFVVNMDKHDIDYLLDKIADYTFITYSITLS